MTMETMFSQSASSTSKCSLVVIWLALVLPCLKARCQFEPFEPKVTVTIKHPPGLGLSINKIAFGPASGKCSDQLIDALISDFVANKIDVVSQENLSTILSGNPLPRSGQVDAASALAIGKIIGPSVLVLVKVTQCEPEQVRTSKTESRHDYKTKNDYNVTVYTSTTRFLFRGSIKSVDLATGQIWAAQNFEQSPESSVQSEEGYPAFPAAFSVQDVAFKAVVWQAHQIYLAWDESPTLIFYDDKDYNLKQAYQALKAGHVEDAFSLSKQNFEACSMDVKPKDKIRGKVSYNLGMMYMVRNKYDSALIYLNQASAFRPGSTVNKAIADCIKAKQLQQSMPRVEDTPKVEIKQTPPVVKTDDIPEQNILTNAGIIDMVTQKVHEPIILQKIKLSKCKFDTSPSALDALTKAGVSDKIVIAMMQK